MKEKKTALVIYGVLLLCVSFSLGVILGGNGNRQEIQVVAYDQASMGEDVYHQILKEEKKDTEEPEATLAPSPEHPLDLNTARQDQLEQLPGVGEGIARRIIAYRTAIGPFVTKEQLMDVEGIGEKRFAEIEPLVTVGGTP